MKTLKIGLIILVVVLVAFTIFMSTSCQKELIPNPDRELYEVQFAPNLYGEVVPWLAKPDSTTKGFVDFVHRFYNHVIRLRNSGGTFIIDIPIITPQPTGTYSYQLPIGQYTAEVIPVQELVMNGNNNYTFNDQFYTANSCNKAAIYTRTPVPFTIAGTLGAPVVLNCVTDMACFQFDIQGVTYQVANIPMPQVVGDFSTGFIDAHNPTGSETTTYSVLQGERLNHNTYEILATAEVTTNAVNGLWFAAAPANIYYLYKFAAIPTAVNVPNGLGGTVAVNPMAPNYLCFGLTDDTGGTFPVIWLRDRYIARTWVANTTLRISYTFGQFIVNQSDWFSTIITK